MINCSNNDILMNTTGIPIEKIDTKSSISVKKRCQTDIQ